MGSNDQDQMYVGSNELAPSTHICMWQEIQALLTYGQTLKYDKNSSYIHILMFANL